MMPCQWCGGELVEVDNPMRRELRHRRGEEARCPGPPNATSGSTLRYEGQLAGTPFVTASSNVAAPITPAAPEPVAACPVCGETWWIVRRSIRIAVEEFSRRRPDAEPLCVDLRSAVVCDGCGYRPPG